MNDIPDTRGSLLIRLRDCDNADAWRQFVEIYAQVIYQFTRRKGLQDADAADVTQEVLRAVGDGMQRFDYDSARGKFRGWLLRVAHNKWCDFLNKQQRQERGAGDTEAQRALEQQPAPADEDAWNDDYEQRIFHWAAEQIRGRFSDATWQAFWQTAIEGRAGQDVANELEMTVAAVYLAKSRVMKKLKEVIDKLDEE